VHQAFDVEIVERDEDANPVTADTEPSNSSPTRSRM